jgi:hypothetical protein
VRHGCKRLGAITAALVALTPAVAGAQQPIDPLGPQLRLTQQGTDGDASIDAQVADVAFNSVRNEYLAVWENRTVTDIEVFGRRLAADGSPIGASFQISGLGADPAGFDSREPAVAYDPERDRYAVAYSRDESVDGDREIFVQLVTGTGTLVLFNGASGATPSESSNIGIGDATQMASSPDIAYRPDTDGLVVTPDGFVVTYDGDDVTNDEFNIYLTGLNAATGGVLAAGFDRDVSAMAATGDGFDPSITVVPGGEDVAVAWEGFLAPADTEIFARRVPGTLPDAGSQTQITTTGAATGNAFDASITANTSASQLLVAYRADEVDNDFEIHVQRLDAGLGQIGTDDQQVSEAGPPGSAFTFTVSSPAVSYHPGLDRYLVTWIGQDTDRPGLSNDEREVMGSTLAASGAELEPQDFTISRVGVDVDEDFAPTDATLAANTGTNRWLSVWSADGQPAADNEFELFGRQVGENFDRDGDGSLVPADCNDANPGIHPGANDVFDNGIDEDCAGGDAQNPDRDGDGSPRPQDCDDANAQIRPGITDVPNNEVDEDCAGGPRRTRPDVDIERSFSVFRGYTKVTRLRIKKLKPGMKVQLRCSGKGCPKPLRNNKVKRVTVKKAGTKDFTKLFKKAKLKPKAVIDVRVLQTGAIGRVDRFIIRKAKLPKREQRCLPPGVKKPQRC